MPYALSLLIIPLFWSTIAIAEPWLANRFSNNCAACHTPGRYTLEGGAKGCTLQCTSCHVNPNGGGLRNEYGIWNQQRWLKSAHGPAWWRNDELKPAPRSKQDFKPDDDNRKVPRLVVVREIAPDEDLYTQKNEVERVAPSFEAFVDRIPKGDPWRLERENPFTVGADFRYFYQNRDGKVFGNEIPDKEKQLSWMALADIGVRYKPVRKNFSLVFETRYQNSPETTDTGSGTFTSNSDIEDVFTAGATVRSAYAIIDKMPYNSFIMYGLYRPGFGYYQTDENMLANRVSGLSNYSVFKGVGFGAAPGLFYFNAHLLTPTTHYEVSNQVLGSRSEGYNVNAGIYGREKGLSLMLSYWNTKNETFQRGRTMYSSTGGFSIWRYTGNLEVLRVEEKFEDGSNQINAGTIYTYDSKLRLFREVYLVGYVAMSNTATDLLKGSATETMAGLSTYLVSGLDLELVHIQRKEEPDSTLPVGDVTDLNLVQFQMHYYF